MWEEMALRKITAAEAKSMVEPGRYRAGETLFLNVAPGGSKSWVQRITIDGRRRDIGLGGYPLVSLAEAREAAFENRKLARAGGDPLAERRRRRTPTFREAARAVHEANKPRWRNDHHIVSWMQTLERHAFPVLGEMPVDRIGREDVLAVLAPIWARSRRRHVGCVSGSAPCCVGARPMGTWSTTLPVRPLMVRCPRCRPSGST